MLAVTLVLGLWIGWQEAPREVGRWYLAAAVEHRVNADYLRITGDSQTAERERQAADAAMSSALHWYPKGGEIYYQRAKWRASDRQYSEALDDCEEAARLGVGEQLIAEQKVHLLMHVGKPGQAVKEAEKIHAYKHSTWNPYDDLKGLNGVAYFRALAKENLPEALANINDALKMLPPEYHSAELLDTRGYVLYQMGKYNEAMVDFKTALPRADRELTALHAGRPSVRTLDHRQFTIDKQIQIKGMGVIYYHGSQVLEKLNRWKDAKELRGKAKELLGREPDETVF
jgi:tetratricopeptide (TPR) repeat protein